MGINVPAAPIIDLWLIHLWLIDLAQPAAAIASLQALLSPEEQARSVRFVQPHDRTHFIAAHAALRQILAATLHTTPRALAFAHGPHGKPYLPGHPLHFNLAHAGGQALLAVSKTLELGVDLEPIRPLPDFLALAQSFAPTERAHLQSLATSPGLPLAFFQCWTRKEAFVKAVGAGLSHPLDSFEVTFHPAPATELHGAGTEHWQLRNLAHLPHFAAALCHPRTPTMPTLEHHTWQP